MPLVTRLPLPRIVGVKRLLEPFLSTVRKVSPVNAPEAPGRVSVAVAVVPNRMFCVVVPVLMYTPPLRDRLEPAPQVTVRAPPVLALLTSSAPMVVLLGMVMVYAAVLVSLILMMSLLVFANSVPAAEKFEVAVAGGSVAEGRDAGGGEEAKSVAG